MVPEGWEEHRLAEVCELINGRGFKPHEWDTEGYPIIRIQNLNGSDEFNYYNGEFNPKILVRDGELLFAWSGSRGTSFGPHIWSGPNAVLNYHTWRVVPKERTSREFLVHYLRHITTEIEATAHGASALVHTQKDSMERRRCVLPPIPEQRKIADILSTWDQAIETSEALLASARRQKRALMQSLLTGKRRFPEFEGQEWKEVRLGDVGRVVTGSTPSTKSDHYYGGPVPFVSPADLGGKKYIKNAQKSLTLEGLAVARAIPEGSTLFTCIGYIGKVGLAAVELVTNQQINAVVPNQELDSEYLFYALSILGPRVQMLAGHNVVPIVNKSEFSAQRIMLPSKAEQRKIASALSAADNEIHNIKRQIELLRTEKKALMQQLLTGKRRVVVDA